MTEKSILEQALLQVQTLEEAVKHNAKGILASTMKQELNEMLKDEEEEEMESQNPEEEDDSLNPEEEKVVASEDEKMSDEEMESDEEDSEEEEDDEETLTSDNDELANDEDSDDSELPDGMDLPSGDEMDLPSGDEMDLPTGDEMDLPTGDDEDVMDMTGASDEEVLKVFKSMKPEDGVVVKKEGNNVELETGDDEFIIKLDEEESPTMEETMDDEMPTEEYSETDEETVYEIELGEEEEEETSEAKKVEATEAARTKSNPHGNKGGANRAGLPSKKRYKAGVPVAALNEEVTQLRKQNDEYKKALVLFKEKLNEVAVFNANLAYATRLFTEHSTTKSEKLSILKRFDGVNTISESKNLYKTIKTELGTKKPVTESVVEKISSTPSTSTSSTTEVLSESKAYENPQFRRMKDLMTKIK